MIWVKLNVGGQTFETQLRTVTKFPDSELAKIFGGAGAGDNDGDVDMVRDVYNIDCDPECFRVILQWLRYLHSLFIQFTIKLIDLLID